MEKGSFSDPKCYCCNRNSKMKIKVQAQHLQPGDIIGSGEKVISNPQAGVRTPKGKVEVLLETYRVDGSKMFTRLATWGKYTMINVEREK